MRALPDPLTLFDLSWLTSLGRLGVARGRSVGVICAAATFDRTKPSIFIGIFVFGFGEAVAAMGWLLLKGSHMRGVVVGTVLSLVLWTALAWAVVCTCTWLDVGWLSSSVGALTGSLMCINVAAISAAVWLPSVCTDEDQQDALEFRPIRLD